MNWGTVLPVIGVIGAAIITYIVAPRLQRRADERRRQQENLHIKANKADEISVEYNQMLFKQLESMAEQHRIDMADVRQRLAESERAREKQGERIGQLERKVVEYEAGMRVAVGFVLIPGDLWQQIRERLPDLPPTRFPGERVVEAGPGDMGGPSE